jgi:hypothetical protein
MPGAISRNRPFIPSQRVPTARTFEFTEGASCNDISPRGGVAFDVFGNGKTSAKFNFGRHLEAAQSPTNPWCANTTSLLRMTALGNYVVPKLDVQLAFTFRSDAGASQNANYLAAHGRDDVGPPSSTSEV